MIPYLYLRLRLRQAKAFPLRPVALRKPATGVYQLEDVQPLFDQHSQK